ncbi:MAG TPA: hypothetical protein VMU16_07310 [Candidatus Binataceae bacterium]|nr:hypothetical protein [Candidatus Binataceae bacterium]
MMATSEYPDTAASIKVLEPSRKPASLIRESPGLILLAIAIADMWRFADPDLWGHVRFGQDILNAGHAIWRDQYSYTASGHPWLNYEWLGEAVMAAMYGWMGVLGLKLMKLGCSALIIIFLAAAIGESGALPIIQGSVLIVTAAMIVLQVQIRPLLFTFLLLSTLLYLLARDCREFADSRPVIRRSRLWLTIPMLAIWANLHAGFISGVVTLWTYAAVAGAQGWFARRSITRMLRLGALAAFSTLATLANPYGIAMWHSVLRTVLNPYTSMFLNEWHPLLASMETGSAAAMYYFAAIALIALLGISLVLGPTGRDQPMVAIAGVMAAAAFMAVRNISIAAIAIAPPLACHLSLAISRRWPTIGSKSPSSAARTALALTSAAALLLFLLTGLFSNRLDALHSQPAGACEFMRQQHLKGNVLAQYSWGEYAIWHLSPDLKVFVDGRYDTVYPFPVLADYFRFQFNLQDGTRALTSYPTDFVLVAPNDPARKLMDSERNWRLVYGDAVSLLYARANSSAAHLSGVPAIGDAPIVTFP